MIRTWRVSAIVLLALLAIGAAARASPPLRPQRYNVLFLNVDLLRADHVGLINPDSSLTPKIDAFFDRGIVFEDVSSGSGATYLSATAVATATETLFNDHSYRRLCRGTLRDLATDGKRAVDHLPTIAQVLRANGYRTAALNEWIHTGKEVFLDRGFDEFIQLPDPGREHEVPAEGEGILLFEDQVTWMSRKLLEIGARPSFLYLHSNSLHSPYRYPRSRLEGDEEFRRLLASLGKGANRYISLHLRDVRQALLGAVRDSDDPAYPELREKLREVARRAYAKQIEYVDDELGRLFSALREADLLAKTIVVLYANHGIGLLDNDVLSVGVVHQSCVHVPLLIRHPQATEAIRIGRPVSLVDLAPTLYEMLGIDPEPEPATHSLLPLLEGGRYGREYLFGRDLHTEYARKGDWKLIITGSQERQLFNLRDDPGETIDRYPEFSRVARELEAALQAAKLAGVRLRERIATPAGARSSGP